MKDPILSLVEIIEKIATEKPTKPTIPIICVNAQVYVTPVYKCTYIDHCFSKRNFGGLYYCSKEITR